MITITYGTLAWALFKAKALLAAVNICLDFVIGIRRQYLNANPTVVFTASVVGAEDNGNAAIVLGYAS